MKYAIGIDIGSTCAKAVVVDETGSLCLSLVQPTGWSSVDTAQALREQLHQHGFDPEVLPCVATGYGRVAVPYARKTITEITCHARGACHLFSADDLTVIDIGGQDTKIIGAGRRGAGLFDERQMFCRYRTLSGSDGQHAGAAAR